MKYCYSLRVKKSTLKATYPIDDEKIERELITLQVEQPKDSDRIGGLYETEDKALDAMLKATQNLSIKKYDRRAAQAYTDYYAEVRSFYIQREEIL